MAGRNERAADISDFTQDLVNKEVRETALFVESEMVRKAAVKDGFLVANFIASVGSPSNDTVTIPDEQRQGTIDTADAVIGLAKSVKYPTIYVQNNLPYSYRVMELGYSQQTPLKALSLTIQKAVNK